VRWWLSYPWARVPGANFEVPDPFFSSSLPLPFLFFSHLSFLIFKNVHVIAVLGAHCELQKFLQYIIVEFTPPSFSFILNPGIISTGLIFPFSYMSA
jgi:hypothetical protein